MAINLSNADYLNSINRSGTGGYTTSSGADLNAGMFNTSSLKAGQTLSGEVVSVDDKNVTLKLTNGQTLNARLDSNANVTVGKMLSFEVSSTTNSISLRPLFSNLNANSTIVSALKAAGLPVTETNGAMTKAMMQEGMSINRNALLDMARSVYSAPGSDPASIVKMVKLGLPIDEMTVNQYENYRNFEHQIINDVNNIADGMGQLIADGILSQDPDSIANITQLMELVDASLIEDAGIGNIVGEMVPSENVISEENVALSEEEATLNPEETSVQNDVQNMVSSLREAISSRVSDFVSSLNIGAAQDEQSGMETADSAVENNLMGKLSELADYLNVSLEENMTDSQKFQFIKVAVSLLNDSASSGKVNEQLLEKLSDLFNQKDTGKLIGNAIKSQLTLTPERVAQKESVDELYDKILKISQKTIDIASQNPENYSDISKSAQNLQNNVNFMNQVNQFVNYVQLPLQMSGENAHGELYVYSNKKNLQENSGNLTALLHLDMEHLGPMDVYVAMQNYTNVTTNFRLADEEVLDFIAANIDQLTQRLVEKGYNVNSSFTVTDNIVSENMPVTDEFLKDNPTASQREIAMVQFDVRA